MGQINDWSIQGCNSSVVGVLSSVTCTSCIQGYDYLNGSCVCSHNYYKNLSDNQCYPCDNWNCEVAVLESIVIETTSQFNLNNLNITLSLINATVISLQSSYSIQVSINNCIYNAIISFLSSSNLLVRVL